MNKIRAKHTALLARPMKHKCTKKFDAEKANIVKFRHYKHPVEPIKNKRLDMLAEPNNLKLTSKWQEAEPPSTCVSRAVLEAVCTPRLDHLSRPTVRVLEAIKKDRSYLGKSFIDFMNDKINMSLDTIYYHNIKSLMNIEAAKQKGKVSITKKAKNFDEFGDKERLEVIASPKHVFPPRPIPKRKRKKLEDLKPRIEKLAIPTHYYRRPSQDSLVLRLKINPLALEYKVTERIQKLTEQPAWRLVKPWVPVAIKRSALLYNISDHMKELAAPRLRARAVETDLKDHPYDINPYALKYVPTPRIIELAKPVDR